MTKLTENMAKILAEENYKEWLEILKTTPNITRLLSKLERKIYDERILKDILEDIRVGLAQGLSVWKIGIYADPAFDYGQRVALMYSLDEGLTYKKAKLIANPDFTKDQMRTLVYGLRVVQEDLLKPYINKAFSPEQLNIIIKGLLNLEDKSQVALFANPRYGEYKMNFIYEKLHSDFYTPNQIRICINEEFSLDQMEQLFREIDNYSIPDEQLETFAKPQYTDDQMELIAKAYKQNFSEEIMELFLNAAFNYYQLKVIYLGLVDDMPLDKVMLYAKPELSSKHMQVIKDAINKGYSEQFIQELVNAELNSHQLNLLSKCISFSRSEEKLKICIIKPWDYNQLNVIEDGIFNLSVSQVNIYANIAYDSNKMYAIYNALSSKKISEEQIKHYAEKGFDGEQLSCIFTSLEDEKIWEKFKPYATEEFNANQMVEILAGVKAGLSKQEIAIYAKSEVSADVMGVAQNSLTRLNISPEFVSKMIEYNVDSREMGSIFYDMDRYKIKYSQIEDFINPNFDYWAYSAIFRGLDKGLSKEQIKQYANDNIPSKQIWQLHKEVVKKAKIKQLLDAANS